MLMDTLEKIEADVYAKEHVDREHLLAFLRLQNTNDGPAITKSVENWLTKLHNDPHYSKVVFADGEIQKILGDLHSYNRLLPQTILELEESVVS